MPLAVVAAGILWGSVTVGPTTPVCRAGTPCSKPAKTTLTFSRANRVVTVKTDAAGRYRVKLPIGKWSVQLGVGMQRTPASVVVRTGTHHVDFGVDTGIR